MITGLPLQTQSPSASLRGFGCKIHCDLAMVQDRLGRVFTPQEIAAHVAAGIKRGEILDNDIPIAAAARAAWERKNGRPCPEWWRSFLRRPADFVRSVSGGLTYEEQRSTVTLPPTGRYDYLEIEWLTASGSHFTLGELRTDRTLAITYNPWPGIALTGIRTLRYVTLI